jgi:hypothetical protein
MGSGDMVFETHALVEDPVPGLPVGPLVYAYSPMRGLIIESVLQLPSVRLSMVIDLGIGEPSPRTAGGLPPEDW